MHPAGCLDDSSYVIATFQPRSNVGPQSPGKPSSFGKGARLGHKPPSTVPTPSLFSKTPSKLESNSPTLSRQEDRDDEPRSGYEPIRNGMATLSLGLVAGLVHDTTQTEDSILVDLFIP